MTNKAKPIPEGHHTVTPGLTVKGADKAIEFYKKAFGATEINRFKGPDGRIMHAEIKIGDSIIFLSDEMPGCASPQTLGGTPAGLYVYVDDVDAVFNRAVSAGAQVKMPVADMFWGDRFGQVMDPFGHPWSLSTHIEDVSPQEMERRGREFFAQMASSKT